MSRQQPEPPIPGLCAVCAYRTAEFGRLDVKEPFGGMYDAGWRTVEGAEMHTILHTWSRAGDRMCLEGARVTGPSLPEGEEHLPMLPVVEVSGAPVCAAHVGTVLPGSDPGEDDEEPVGPAKPGIPRCTATWTTPDGTARCWRRAIHNQRVGYEAHMGETEQGYRWQWIGTEPGATPHRPEPDATACTPIPAATLQQMAEVPPELLVEMNHAARLDEDHRAWVKVARVRDVIADMENITGARHWARILRKAVGEDEARPQDTAARPATWAQRADGTWTLPVPDGSLEAAASTTPEEHARLAEKWATRPGCGSRCTEGHTYDFTCEALRGPAPDRPAPAATEAAGSACTPQCADAPGIRGLLEHVGIDTRGRDITVAGKVVDAARPEPDAVAGQPLTDTQVAALRAADLPPGTRITREAVDEATRQTEEPTP